MSYGPLAPYTGNYATDAAIRNSLQSALNRHKSYKHEQAPSLNMGQIMSYYERMERWKGVARDIENDRAISTSTSSIPGARKATGVWVGNYQVIQIVGQDRFFAEPLLYRFGIGKPTPAFRYITSVLRYLKAQPSGVSGILEMDVGLGRKIYWTGDLQ